MIELRLRGVRLRLDFSFFAVLLLFLLLDKSGYGLMGLYACLIHELGHVIAMAFCGCRPDHVDFYGAGIRITSYDEYKLAFWPQLAVLAFGSLANFISFGLLYATSEYDLSARMFAVIHLLIGLFNMLPLPVFDGGRILSLLLGRLMGPQTADTLARLVGTLVLGLLLAGAVWLYVHGRINFTAVGTAAYLTVVALFSAPAAK